jgi:hypothetical protein
MTIGVGMVPNGAAGVIAVGDIVAVAVIAAAVPGMGVATAFGAVDDVGTGIGATAGDGRGGNAGGCGAGIVEPGKSDMNDEAGCADSVSIGAAVLPPADVGEVAGTAGAADNDGVAPVVAASDDREATGTAGVPGVICPVGVEQVTTVPGIVGSEAVGTGANVVSGAPGRVVAENGLGPLSGEVTIVAGVDESPMAVVPMVETCAKAALQPNSRAAVMRNKRRIAIIASAPI